MLSGKLVEELNLQIKYELYSANLYLAMAAYCASQNLDGFVNFFTIQASEERLHAMKFFNFLKEKHARIHIAALDQPKGEYKTVIDLIEAALKHEQFVTKRIYGLMDLAVEEKEHSTISFLKWFVDEQVEEEATFSELLSNLQLVGTTGSGIIMIDGELGKRVLSAPAPQVE